VTESRCIPIEELARVRDLPAGSPEREHADRCPRCRAALLALAEFERADESLPEEAGAARAHARLDAVIESLVTPEPATAAPATAPPRREGPGWLARLLAPPAMRWAAGVAALAIVAAGAWYSGRGPADRLERGEGRAAGAVSVRASGDDWMLAWTAVEGADAYDVVFLSVDLRELSRVTDVREPRLALSRGSLPAGVAPGVPLLVEVDARQGGEVLSISPPSAIELR
jgi:hypothetical protein